MNSKNQTTQVKLKFYQKLAFKFIIIIVIILVTLTILLNLLSINRQREILTRNLESKASTITRIISLTCSNAIIGGDFTFLDESIKAVAKDSDVAYGIIIDRDNYVLVHTDPKYLQKQLKEKLDVEIVKTTDLLLTHYYSKELKKDIIDAAFPIMLRSGEKWGVVRFGFSKTNLNKSINEAYQLAGATAIIFILVGILIAFALSKFIARPVEILVNQATEVTQGNLEKEIRIRTKSEIGLLANAFDAMRISLKNKIVQLARKIDELSSLHDVGLVITSTLEESILIQRVLDASVTLGYSRAFLLFLDESHTQLAKGVGINLSSEQEQFLPKCMLKLEKNNSLLSQILHSRKSTILNADSAKSDVENHFFLQMSIENTAVIPMQVKERDLGLLFIDGPMQKETIEENDLILLTIFASQVAIALENARLYRETAQKQRMEMELQTAKNIQTTLLPQKPPVIEGLDLAGVCIPATEVGGDYYDFLEFSDQFLGLAIGDVNGHGVPAGIIMALAKSALRTQIKNDFQPGNVMPILNSVLYDAAQRKLLMTFFYALYDLQTRSLTFSNAGQNFPYVYRSRTGKLEELLLGGPPLGFKKDRQYSEKQIQLEKGDILILYSDGIVEAENNEREMYDYERFERIITESAKLSASEIQKHILEDLEKFADGRPADDDITLMVIKLNT